MILLILAVTITASAPLVGAKSMVATIGLNRGKEIPEGLSASKLNSSTESSGFGSAELSLTYWKLSMAIFPHFQNYTTYNGGQYVYFFKHSLTLLNSLMTSQKSFKMSLIKG